MNFSRLRNYERGARFLKNTLLDTEVGDRYLGDTYINQLE